MVRISVRLPARSYEATAEIMSEEEFNKLWVLDTIKVESQELAEEIVTRYNLERQERLNPMSLASVLKLVQEDMKKELNQDDSKTDKFAQMRSERKESFAQAQEEARQELLRDELEQRALLRVKLLSRLMPTLMQQALDHFKESRGSEKLISISDLIKDGYEVVDEMISQSGLDDI